MSDVVNNTGKFAVLIKPEGVQPALDRAAQYTRFVPGIKVTAVRVVNDARDGDESQASAKIHADFEKLKRHYPSIVNFELKIIFNKNVAEAFLQECHQGGYDLAIISANKRNTIKDLFINTIDSSIMRKCFIPLLVVKDANSTTTLGQAVLVAIDFSDSSHIKALDEHLFRSASMFAHYFNGEVHVANCVLPHSSGLMSGNIALSKVVTGGTDNRYSIHRLLVSDFAKEHHIPEDHVHLIEGRVDEEIPRLCAKLNARMVCMGATPKSTFFGSIDSSASELVLEQIKGDVFVVNCEPLNQNSGD